MEVIRINLIAGRWWLQPSPWTFSRSRWAPRVYPNLKKLLVIEKLLDRDVIISLNKDKDLDTFRALQQIKDLKVFLSKKDVAQILSGAPLDYKVPRKKLIVRFDKKSLKCLRAGFLPFVSTEFLWNQRNNVSSVEYRVFIWRKQGFIDISEQVQKDGTLDVARFKQEQTLTV